MRPRYREWSRERRAADRFSTLAFPDASLATALPLGRGWGYGGVELRLIDGELIDPSMPAAARAEVRRTAAAAGLPIVAVDSSIRQAMAR
jgi:hypothetical protein